MSGYQPLYIRAMETGLVQSRQNFLLPNDAYPVLENAYVWRERILRKPGCELLGRLARCYTDIVLGNFPAAVPTPPFSSIIFTGNLYASAGVVPETNANIELGSVSISTFAGAYVFQDFNQDSRLITTESSGVGYNEVITNIIPGVSTTIFIANSSSLLPNDIIWITGVNGPLGDQLNNTYRAVLSSSALSIVVNAPTSFSYTGGGRIQVSPGIVNYLTGDITLIVNNGFQGQAITDSFCYNPALPVMGLRTREINSINNEELVAFDQKYAYIFNGTSFEEFLSNTAKTWNGNDSDFFWTTNYWVGTGSLRIFWSTNFNAKGLIPDPIRYTNGVALTDWVDFAPQIDSAGNVLAQCLAMLPFRGRLVVFNTFEGPDLATSNPFPQRIRWAAIGNPFTVPSAIVATVNSTAWRDDIRGNGGFLDIPTSESIVSVGFVRDNLVIYCERSTWQLRYTGRSIAPFQIEKVNSELGSESTFSSVQFDTSLVGIGDKGIVECDSFKSNRIDIKIPDLVFQFNNDMNGTKRVHGIRDFIKRLAYWTYPYAPDDQQFPTENYFPNKRLVYNYENDSWAIFDDSYTTLGNYQPAQPAKWSDFNDPGDIWSAQNNTWISRPALIPLLVGGNQQGYVEILDPAVDVEQIINDVSLYISNITANTTTPTVVKSINHNLLTGAVVELSIPGAQPFNNLDGQVFGIIRVDENNFRLMVYDPNTGQFSSPQLDVPIFAYQGAGQIIVRDNFTIKSKKFNFLDDGQNIQLGYIDILMNDTDNGEISLNVYLDYNDTNPINIPPDNANPLTQQPDTFFNSVVPTSVTPYRGSSKNWQRVFCAARGAFLTIEWTFSNAQMAGDEQEEDVQIDAQILWIRKAGKNLPIGI